MNDFSGKRILITGASGVLGGLIARGLHDAGATVVLAGRQSEQLQALGIPVEMYALDLSTPGASQSLINTVATNGSIDGIVAAHGIVAFGPASELETTTLLKIVETNLTSVIELVCAAHSDLVASAAAGNNPFVATISGIIADMPTANMAAYGASKAGLKSFMSALQREWRREGIQVIDCRPPHTETGLVNRAIAGTAPTFPAGLEPEKVAHRIITALGAGEKDLPAEAFS